MRRAVKYRSVLAELSAALIGGALGLSGLHPSPARAQILGGGGLGPAPPRPPPTLDARIPSGAEATFPPRPPGSGESPACSLGLAPLCVHRGAGVAEGSALSWLAALELAHARLAGALGLPAPLPDGARGGSAALDVYLSLNEPGLTVALDPPDPEGHRDRASAFCVASPDGSDLELERAATLCLGEAIAAALDAAETPFSRRALAHGLWIATGRPSSADARAFDDFQAAPERAAVARDPSKLAEGGALLPHYLGVARAAGDPVAPAVATYALSGWGASPPGLRFVNEPDTVDVLRATFGPRPSDVARLFGDFAVARAFLGSRDAEGRWPLLEWLGDFGRVRFEWSVPLSSLPRRLAPARPVEPLGATYLWVAVDQDPGARVLAMRAEWEDPISFSWTLLVLEKDGRVRRRVDVPYLERGTSVERTLGDLSGASGVLIAGTNLGGLGPTFPFDPDFEPFEPHAYSVYLAFE